MSRIQRIQEKITAAFAIIFAEVKDESSMHAVPEGAETHVRIFMVSPNFEGLSRVERAQKVQQCLTQELNSGLHALSLQLLTPNEWNEGDAQGVISSPACAGKLVI